MIIIIMLRFGFTGATFVRLEEKQEGLQGSEDDALL